MAEAVTKHRSKPIRLTDFKSSYPKAFYWLILVNVVMDILAFWSEPGGVTAIVRVLILYSAFFYFLLVKKIRFELNFYILFFSIYSLLQLFVAVDFSYSIKVTFQIITSLLMFYVGFALVKNEFDFYYYLKQFLWIYLIIIANTLVSNFFDFGLDDYTQSTDYVVGGLNDAWNSNTYILIMLPLLLSYKVNKKWILYISAFLVLIFLMISLKRTAIIGITFATMFFFFLYGKKVDLIKKAFLFFILIGISFPFYSNILKNRIDVRVEEGRFTNDFYESEGRYLEFNYLKEKISRFEDPLEIAIGLKAFDSRGVVGDGERQFHIDYTLIAFTLGLFGLFLYLMIYVKLIFDFFHKYKVIRRYSFVLRKYKIHLATAWVLIFTSLLTSFGGQMYHVSSRLIIFMTLGAIYSLLNKEISRMFKNHYAGFNRL